MIWQSYIKWVQSLGSILQEEKPDLQFALAELAISIYKRYIKLNSQAREDLLVYLLEIDRVEDALPILEEIISL